MPLTSMRSTRGWLTTDAGHIPRLFLDGCVGNLREAREKWERARKWRQDFEIDKVCALERDGI